MKPAIAAALILTLFALVLPMIMAAAFTPQTDEPVASPEAVVSEAPKKRVTFDGTSMADAAVPVQVKTENGVVTMTLADYLVGVVAAEMPATFEPEAISAQVVAARTYTMHKMLVDREINHPEADVCTDIACCKAYQDDDALSEKWGDSYSAYIEKIVSAVKETDGVYMQYEGEPILAVFHSSSAGKTETSGNVWGKDLPYLTVVDTPEDGETVPNYITEVRVSQEDFASTVYESLDGLEVYGEPEEWITDTQYDESGRLENLYICGISVPGTKLREMFELRSTAVEIYYGDGEFVFTVTGYGHGVGMSQYGANSLAAEGKSYKDILNWYYKDITFASTKDLF